MIEQLGVYGNAVLFTLGALLPIVNPLGSAPICTTVFLRLSSFILLCIGVSIIWSGVVDLVRPLLTERR